MSENFNVEEMFGKNVFTIEKMRVLHPERYTRKYAK